MTHAASHRLVAESVDQVKSLPGTAESVDRLGNALALGRHSDDTIDRAFIGVFGGGESRRHPFNRRQLAAVLTRPGS